MLGASTSLGFFTMCLTLLSRVLLSQLCRRQLEEELNQLVGIKVRSWLSSSRSSLNVGVYLRVKVDLPP